MDEFRRVFREKRLAKGVSQTDLGQRTGVLQSAIAHMEAGDRPVAVKTFGRLVAGLIKVSLGVKVAELNVTGQTEDGRPRYEAVAKKGERPITIPLEGKRPLGENEMTNSLWPTRTKQRQLAILADLLDAALERPPLVVRAIAERVRRGT